MKNYRVFQKFIPVFSSLKKTLIIKNAFYKTKYVIHYSFNIEQLKC